MKKVQLVDLLDEWLKNHKRLRRYYDVYRIKDWDARLHGEWPDLLEDAEAFIGMTCDGIGLGLAIMDDHVWWKHRYTDPRIKIMAADKTFFKKVARDLITFHGRIHRNHKCNTSI